MKSKISASDMNMLIDTLESSTSKDNRALQWLKKGAREFIDKKSSEATSYRKESEGYYEKASKARRKIENITLNR